MNGNTLPCFDDPPLQEVAISVQFEPLQHLVVPEIGRLWQHYEKKGYQHDKQKARQAISLDRASRFAGPCELAARCP